MTKRKKILHMIIPSVIMAFVALTHAQVCSISDAEWAATKKSEKTRLLGDFKVNSSDENCFCIYSRRLLESGDRKATQIYIDKLKERATHGFPLNMLFCLARIDELRNDPSLMSATVMVWENHSQPYNDILSGLINDRKYFESDTLYSILNNAGRLRANEFLRWARVKGVLNKFSEATELYCKFIIALPRLAYIAMNQMAKYIDDTETDTIAGNLNHLIECVLENPGVDTVGMRDWVADYCSEKGLFEMELQTLRKLETSDSPIGHRLWKSAMNHFATKRYRLAATAGQYAYERIFEEDIRTEIATLLYQSFLQIAQNDSALIWLERADLSDTEHQVQAASLYQHTGHQDKALILIEKMTDSFSRDTLLIRHYLYSGEPQKALLLVREKDSLWQGNHLRDALLWRARSALFSLDLENASVALDSISFSSFWHGTEEVLELRYWLRRLHDSESALQLWANLQYKLYIGDLKGATELVEQSTVDKENLQLFTVEIGKKYITNGQELKALEIFQRYSKKEMSAELMYYKALVLHKIGNVEEATGLLKLLLTEYPMNVYAEKARILLLNIAS